MAAFLLTLAIFFFWGIVGFALIALLGSRRNLLKNCLLAPVTGAAATVLVIVWVNRLGAPLRLAGPPIAIVLVLSSLLVLWRLRPVFPIAQLRPFLLVLLLAALVTGYPMFRFGFNWVSYSNDDMANYCLGANAFLNHGYLNVPDRQAVVNDGDASSFFWYFAVYHGMRSGCEETLAWVASCTGLSTHQIFMVTILALHLLLICTTTTLILHNRKYRPPALLLSVAMSVSSLVALGTAYQLIAQVFGLSLLAGNCTLLLEPVRQQPKRLRIRRTVLLAILAAGAAVVYPEILPFLVLSFALYHSILLIQKRTELKILLRALAPAFCCCLILLSPFLANIIGTLAGQAFAGAIKPAEQLATHVRTTVLFPYYLVPSGFAQLWGFFPIGKALVTSQLNVLVPLGMLLFLCCAIGGIWLAWMRERSGVTFVVMAALFGPLFYARADFGLFKLAMYIQPFLLAVLVLMCWHLGLNRRWNRWLFLAPILGVSALGARSQIFYIQRSAGGGGNGGAFVEINRASESGLLSYLVDLSKRPRHATVISDSYNVVLAKFQSAYLAPVYFPVEDYFKGFGLGIPRITTAWFNDLIAPNLQPRARAIFMERLLGFEGERFNMHNTDPEMSCCDWAAFEVRKDAVALDGKSFTLLESGPALGILNRSTGPAQVTASEIRALPSESVKNHLVFIASSIGRTYYSDAAMRETGRLISMYQAENDYFFPNRIMASLGRFALLWVVNPSPKVRLVVECTASLNADKENRVPPASAVGTVRLPFPALGRGSARLISPPIEPQALAGNRYVSVDMGTWGSYFPESRQGIMKLYGQDVRTDLRRIVGFARDISAISEEDYASLQAPSEISRFPGDLANKHLEYSGVYEDGWVAESSFVTLQQREQNSQLILKIMVPEVRGSSAASLLTILEDGVEIGRKSLNLRYLDVRIPALSGAGRHRIELRFDRAISLPAPDYRPVSALIRTIRFESTALDSSRHVGSLRQ